MSNVDLEALAVELRTIGYDAEVHPHNQGTYLLAKPWLVYSDGEVQVYNGVVTDAFWSAFDIIRRAVSPAPAGELRDRIMNALQEHHVLLDPELAYLYDWSVESDAVLAVLCPEGAHEGEGLRVTPDIVDAIEDLLYRVEMTDVAENPLPSAYVLVRAWLNGEGER